MRHIPIKIPEQLHEKLEGKFIRAVANLHIRITTIVMSLQRHQWSFVEGYPSSAGHDALDAFSSSVQIALDDIGRIGNVREGVHFLIPEAGIQVKDAKIRKRTGWRGTLAHFEVEGGWLVGETLKYVRRVMKEDGWLESGNDGDKECRPQIKWGKHIGRWRLGTNVYIMFSELLWV